ncbi:hypothetical protein HPB52_000134 [Rhipicephalus sanguineus]|uniref:SWIM-type domain-containing protein n=1 Tax=Rhipicephalus sanguineus TaxID=34632 RepID=A0A9D4Q4P9_RHISA|nr:hypothetical protein HPB52_000134 [Rhipicephalus sanguineus]
MENAVLATCYHMTSTDQKPQHSRCPKGEESWCAHNKAVARQQAPPKHRYNLSEHVAEDLLPVYTHLSDRKLNVTQAHCTCRGGISGQCKHAAAVVTNVNKEDTSTKTSVENVWKRPSAKQLGMYKGVLFSEMYPPKPPEQKLVRQPTPRAIDSNCLLGIMLHQEQEIAETWLIWTRYIKRTSESLAQQLVTSPSFKSAARAYDISKEPVARKEYKSKMSRKVIQVGLAISTSQPWLCCSPDDLIDEEEGIRLLEIKAPYRRESQPVVDRNINVNYPHFNGKKLQLGGSQPY